MVVSKLISSLDKCFYDSKLTDLQPLRRISGFLGQQVSMQMVYCDNEAGNPYSFRLLNVAVEGDLAPLVRFRRVESVPVALAAYEGRCDGDYLRTTPGLYPDLLLPLSYEDRVALLPAAQLRSLWIDVMLDGEVPAGDHTLTFRLLDKENVVTEQSVTLHLIGAKLPKNEAYVTQWFYCDCLAQYYDVEPFSERHWEIVESFARTAAEQGINLLLTPLFTPPLDTAVGGERLTTQLVGVTKVGEEYSFDFSLLDRWVDMCDRVGIPYLEIAHFFTQWGAAHAPKIMATVDGVEKKIFGWETQADGEEYSRFLRTFIPAFLSHMKARGDDKRCLFHVSDEPSLAHLEQYRRSRGVIKDLLDGYLIIDALSKFEFYEQGVVDHPVPASDHIEPFIEAKVPDLWVYYCCSQGRKVSNRFMSMPGARTRCLGTQMFKYDIVGFLQWGFNYYNNRYSYNTINPYQETSGEFFFPAGDGFSVYPAPDGTAYESMRLLQFREGLEDYAVMRLAATLVGKERVVAEIEKIVGEVRFDRCVVDSMEMLAVRERVNALVEENLPKA